MATLDLTPRRSAPAIVTKAHVGRGAPEEFLLISPAGQAMWVEDADAATAFASMREATRMAMRLPSNLRAFSLPLGGEGALGRLH